MTTAIKVECLHDARGVCWLCSDQDPRWVEWRVKAGLPVHLPNSRRFEDPIEVAALPVIETPAPKKMKTMNEGDWRRWYQRLYGKRRAS